MTLCGCKPVGHSTLVVGRDQRLWRGKPISVAIEDNNLLLIEFASGALCTAVGSDCRGSRRVPWGALTLYGTAGVLEVTDIHLPSAYPIGFEVQGGLWSEGGRERASREFTAELTEQRYLRGEHLRIEEPHIYVDIMDLVDAIRDDRRPGATGEQARHVVEIIEKARTAARTGQAQELESSF
jgi:predicted dehydrogenase